MPKKEEGDEEEEEEKRYFSVASMVSLGVLKKNESALTITSGERRSLKKKEKKRVL